MSQRMAVGALWMILAKLLERGLGLISTLILVRLLIPSDFGIVAMAMSIIALLELFSAFGMDTVLLQRNAGPLHYHTAWTMNVMAGCAVALTLALVAWPASGFYREPRLLPVMLALALGAAIQGLENVGVVEFRKDLQFDKEFRYMMTKKLVGFSIAVPLAFLLRNYWALVIGTLASRFGIVVYSYFAHPFRPRFSLAAAGELLHFSKWLMMQDALTFLKEHSATFIIGPFVGPAALGTFSVSAEIANMPGTELVAPINRAVLPVYVRVAADPIALGREYLSVMSGITLLAVPAVAGIALTAPFIVLLALGRKWMDATPLLQILAFSGLTQVLHSNSNSAFIALGKPGVFARISAFHVAVLLVFLLLLAPQYGAHGAAWAYLIAAVAALPVNFYFVTRCLRLRARNVVAGLWRPLASAAIMYGVGWMWGPRLHSTATSSTDAIAPLFTFVALGMVTYIVSDLLLWLASGRPPGAETWVLRQLRILLEFLRKKLSASPPE